MVNDGHGCCAVWPEDHTDSDTVSDSDSLSGTHTLEKAPTTTDLRTVRSMMEKTHRVALLQIFT